MAKMPVAFPFPTQALKAAAHVPNVTLLLRGGTYYTQGETLGPEHSGLTLQNYEGEHAVVSGGVPLDGATWQPYKINPAGAPQWKTASDVNNVYGRANLKADGSQTVYLGYMNSLEECMAAANASERGPFGSVTFHGPHLTGGFNNLCYGSTTQFWSPTPQDEVDSARNTAAWPSNIWVADLSQFQLPDVLGLRINGVRAVRAKYPNGNPELVGPEAADMMQYKAGWVGGPTAWVKPADKWKDTKDVVSNATHWPGVNWPMSEEGSAKQSGAAAMRGDEKSDTFTWVPNTFVGRF
jgi:hypothetical protein